MKSRAALGLSMGELPTDASIMAKNEPAPMWASHSSAVFGASQELSDAIGVVAYLTEQAGRTAGNGASELAMAHAFSATFEYMVAYLHYLTIDHDAPNDTVVKAAVGLPELGASELDFSLRLGSHTE